MARRQIPDSDNPHQIPAGARWALGIFSAFSVLSAISLGLAVAHDGPVWFYAILLAVCLTVAVAIYALFWHPRSGVATFFFIPILAIFMRWEDDESREDG